MRSLTKLIVSQNDLRHSATHLQQMIDYVKGGGYFTQEAMHEWATINGDRPDPPLIAVSRFPDGKEMIHDGHNRAVCMFLAGRSEIQDNEYFILNFTYEEYIALEPTNNWFTPFDPRTHIRKAEFGDYKRAARQFYVLRPDHLDTFVKTSLDKYCVLRDLWTVLELAAIVKRRL
jgi:hypothetical protein